jgi:ribosomal-protein-alanine N-acetyltransferase
MLARPNDAQVLGMLDARSTEHGLNIGYVLAREHWGHGYMPEAIQALTEIALSQPALFRIEATCDVENHPSTRALEKSGFVREGRLARYTVHPNLSSEPRDCWIYAKSR